MLTTLLRAPTRLYDWRAGWLLRRRFLRLTHVGRRTGRRYQTMLEVVAENHNTHELIVVAGLGRSAQWYRNLLAGKATEVAIARERFAPSYRELGVSEAAAVLAEYERRNRYIAPIVRRVLSWLVGWHCDGTEAPTARERPPADRSATEMPERRTRLITTAPACGLLVSQDPLPAWRGFPARAGHAPARRRTRECAGRRACRLLASDPVEAEEPAMTLSAPDLGDRRASGRRERRDARFFARAAASAGDRLRAPGRRASDCRFRLGQHHRSLPLSDSGATVPEVQTLACASERTRSSCCEPGGLSLGEC